eukprot:366402-Chlamydomonas_euryale.AAC.10
MQSHLQVCVQINGLGMAASSPSIQTLDPMQPLVREFRIVAMRVRPMDVHTLAWGQPAAPSLHAMISPIPPLRQVAAF